MYARQLHEHYSGAAAQQQPQPLPSRTRYNENLPGSRQGRPGANPNPDDVHWRSFFDGKVTNAVTNLVLTFNIDDLPEIRENIRKGFVDTQKTVNSWITTFKKKIDGEDDEETPPPQPPRPNQNQYPNYAGPQGYARRSNDMTRRSADMQSYDADPQLIGDDFSKLELRAGEAAPRTTSRPLANPNLFRPDSAAGRKSPNSSRRVAFHDGPPQEIKDLYSGPTKSATSTSPPLGSTKSSKWQPLAAVAPSPVTENDPFSLGDSDDDKDAKPITLKDDEEDQLQKATAQAMSEGIGGGADAEPKK